MHYSRWQRYGNFETVNKPGKKKLGDCLHCDSPAVARDLCGKHYQRWSKFGDPLVVKLDRDQTTEERFWSKVDKNGPVPGHAIELGQCWIWMGTRIGDCGVFSIKNRPYKAHVLSYTWVNGETPYEFEHLCHVKSCVRPDHISPAPGFVYVIRSGASDFYKIGWSRDPKYRLKDLQIGNPLPLELVGTVPGSTRTEAKWHVRFKNKRACGEWFELTEEEVRIVLFLAEDPKTKRKVKAI